MINRADYTALKVKINDENYYENFVSLTKVLAPDGERISQTGFTISRNGQQKGVALKRKQETFKDEINKIKADKNEVENQQAPEFVKLIGTLKIADAKQNTIQIVPVKGANSFKQKIKVSEGLSDVVKMYFDEVVEVNLIKKDGKIYELKEIDRA